MTSTHTHAFSEVLEDSRVQGRTSRCVCGARLWEPAAKLKGPYEIGKSYQTQGGETVTFVGVANEGTIYETMHDEHGVHRYTTRDFGRVTGTAHDYSDPRNVPPPTSHGA